MGKYLLLWVPMVLIAIANGAVRQAGYGQYLSELRAHQVSTLIGLVLFGVYFRLSLGVFPPASASQAWAVGFLWLTLTVVFEFLFGHYVAGHAWLRLLQDYNLLAGRLWVLILVWLTVGPRVVYGWRG